MSVLKDCRRMIAKEMDEVPSEMSEVWEFALCLLALMEIAHGDEQVATELRKSLSLEILVRPTEQAGQAYVDRLTGKA